MTDVARALDEIERAIHVRIVGAEETIDQILVALLAGGHALLEGPPGIGKTLLVQTLGEALGLRGGRIQFTPDLMPADVTGTTILVEEDGTKRFRFQPGPVFTHLLLADEINRATPKTQSALLEAMAERSVTVAGERHVIEDPFVVLATQNPIEMEGTYPLPEAQLDRFFFKIRIDQPSEADLIEILARTTGAEAAGPEVALDREGLLAARAEVRTVEAAPEVLRDAARLVIATQPDGPAPAEAARRWLRYGAGPRAARTMVLAAKVAALRAGRRNAALDDLRHYAVPALRHRLLLNFEAEAGGVDPDDVVRAILDEVPPLPPAVERLASA